MGPPSLARAVSRQRPVHDQPAEICLHSDASDLGYGGTIGSCQEAGSPGQLDLQGLWETEDCKDSKSVRELRAVRLLGARHFAAQLKDPQIRKVLLWEHNQAVVAAINKLASSSPAMMSELRRLQKVLERFEVQIAARWHPSPLNKYADRLSMTWNVLNLWVEDKLVTGMRKAFGMGLEAQMFPHPPMGDHPVAVRKQAWTKLQEPSGMGCGGYGPNRPN
jgi:hypothetical protein